MSQTPLKILLVEDDLVDQMSFKRMVKTRELPYNYQIANSVARAKEILSDNLFDLVLIDYNLGDGTAFDIFDYIVDTPFIFITGGGDERIAVEAMKAGAFYYHIKDPDRNYLELLPVSIEKALRERQMELDQKAAEEALKESEEKFRTISSAANDAIIMMDYEGNVTFWNKAAEKIFGYKKSEILKKNLHQMISTDIEGQDYLRSLKFYWQSGTESAIGKQVEMKVKRKNGTLFDIELSQSAVKIGQELNSILIIRDITERKQAQQALQDSEERYRTLQANIPVGIYRSSADGRFLSANPAMVRILGFNNEKEMFSANAADLYIKTGQRQEFIDKISREGSVSAYELQLTRQDGSNFWAAVTAKSFTNPQDNQIYFDGLLEDITVQKEAQEQLRQSKERLDIILQNIGNGVMVIDQDQNIILMNRRTRELLGFPSDQPDLYSLQACLENCLDQGHALLNSLEQDYFRNLPLVVEKPYPRILYITATPFTDIDGRLAGKIFILADVTREKEIEQMKTDFVSSVSHELRTPITSIMGFAKTIMLTSNISRENLNEFINIIYNESERLANLIEDVLSISRIESGRVSYKFKSADIVRIIENVYQIYKMQAEEKGLKITLELPADRPQLILDQDSIHQVLVNLIGNAIKFTEPGGSVAIRLFQEKGVIILEVADTGMGIPLKDQERIFEKFYRVPRPGKEIPGTGLGLSIVKQIIDAHRGHIKLSSKENQGTTFRIILTCPVQEDTKNNID